MHLRSLIRQKWNAAGLYTREDAHLQAFLKHVDDTPSECWREYVALFRRKYYDLFDQIVPPLVNTDDKLLRVTLIRWSDLNQRKERAALRDLIRCADPVHDRPELNAILTFNSTLLRKEFVKRPELAKLVQPVMHRHKVVTSTVRQPLIAPQDIN